MDTELKQKVIDFYDELDILFNYIDYQLKKENFNYASPAILELYDSIHFESFLKNKKSAIFQDYVEIVEENQINMDNENNLICLIYIFSNRYKNSNYFSFHNKEERKYYQRKMDLLKDSFDRLDRLNPDSDFIYKIKSRNKYYSLDKAFKLNPSPQNCFFIVRERVKDIGIEIKEIRKEIEIYLKESGEPNFKNEIDYYLQNNKKKLNSSLEKNRKELLNAIDLVKTIINKNQNVYYLFDLLGELYYLNNEIEIAKDYFFKSLKINPNYSSAWKNLFDLLFESNDFRQITALAKNNISLNIYSDIDYRAYLKIRRVVLSAFSEVKEYAKGIDFYLHSENSFSEYLAKRNKEIRLSSSYLDSLHPTTFLYERLPDGLSCSERVKVLEMIIKKIGYDISVCRDYVLAYIAFKDGTVLKNLDYSELKDICTDKDKKTSPKFFRLHEYESELEFGKYKGKKIEEIIESNFNYLSWCVENIGGFYLSPVILTNLIQKKGEKQLPFTKLNMSKLLLDEIYEQEEYDNENNKCQDTYDYGKDTWYAMTDGNYGDYPGGNIDYDFLGY